jgi:hypothetical protein
LALATGGCATWETLTFSPDRTHSDKTKNQTAQLYYVHRNWLADRFFAERLTNMLPEDGRAEITTTLATCAGREPAAPEFAPLLLFAPAAAKYVFDIAADALAGSAEELQSRGDRGYNASIVLTGGEAQTVSGAQPGDTLGCLVLLRTATDGGSKAEPGMVTIIRLTGYPNMLRFEPVYVRFDNAMALTERGEGAAGGRIDALYTIAVSVARPAAPGGYPKQVTLGVGAFSLEGVQLGMGKSALMCGGPKPCLVQTKSIDRPDDATTSIEFSVAVREIGTQVNEAKRAQAQIKAIKDAVGPKIRDAVEGVVAGRQ